MMSSQVLSEGEWGMVIQACLQDISCGWALGASSVLRQTNTQSSQSWKLLWCHLNKESTRHSMSSFNNIGFTYYSYVNWRENLKIMQAQLEQVKMFIDLLNTLIFIITTMCVSHSLLLCLRVGASRLKWWTGVGTGWWQRETVSLITGCLLV